MALVGRSPVRLAATTSSAPYESMVSSLQAHIDQLVQKNKTYEHTIQKLQAAIQDEKEKSLDTASRMKASAALERETWREGCDSLLATHRIVHLRTNVELEKTRSLVLREKEENRRERLSVLQRDYKLTLFQARELELETRIAELEDLLEGMAEQNEQDAVGFVQQHENDVEALKDRLNKLEAARKEAHANLREVEEDKERLEKELASLRQEHTSLISSSTSSTTKLERVSLQLEGALSSKAQLEEANSELKRSNADLQRQLDKWQNLETKGGAEIEELRKRRIELEVRVKELEGRVKELESRVKEMEKSEKESSKALEKERRKVEKLKTEIDKLQELIEETQDLLSSSKAEEHRLTEELAKSRAESEEVRGSQRPKPTERARPSRKGNTPAIEEVPTEPDPEPTPGSEREVLDVITPKPVRTRSKPAGKVAQAKAREQLDESGDEVPAPRKVAKGKGKAKAKAESESERESGEPSGATKKRKYPAAKSSKPPSKQKRKASSTSDENDSEQSDHSATPQATKKDTKGKGRAVPASQTTSTEPPAIGKGKGGSISAAIGANAGKGKPSRRGEKGNSSEEETQPKKKKKLFPQAQPMSFAWDSLPKGDNGLGIPTELSPVKETDVVPARSIFGKVGSALRWKT